MAEEVEIDQPVEESEVSLGPPVPATVTLAWLFHNVPWKFWTAAVSALIAAFLLGIAAAQIGWVRDLVWRNELKSVSTKAPSISDGEKPKPGEPSSSTALVSNEFIRESSAKELANYFSTIAPLQQKALFESSYLSRRVSWKGKVGSISEDYDGSYRVLVRDLDDDRYVLTHLSLAKTWRGQVERLRKGDRVAYEGVIKDFDILLMCSIEVDKFSVQPPDTPTPTPAPTSERRASQRRTK